MKGIIIISLTFSLFARISEADSSQKIPASYEDDGINDTDFKSHGHRRYRDDLDSDEPPFRSRKDMEKAQVMFTILYLMRHPHERDRKYKKLRKSFGPIDYEDRRKKYRSSRKRIPSRKYGKKNSGRKRHQNSTEMESKNNNSSVDVDEDDVNGFEKLAKEFKRRRFHKKKEDSSSSSASSSDEVSESYENGQVIGVSSSEPGSVGEGTNGIDPKKRTGKKIHKNGKKSDGDRNGNEKNRKSKRKKGLKDSSTSESYESDSKSGSDELGKDRLRNASNFSEPSHKVGRTLSEGNDKPKHRATMNSDSEGDRSSELLNSTSKPTQTSTQLMTSTMRSLQLGTTRPDSKGRSMVNDTTSNTLNGGQSRSSLPVTQSPDNGSSKIMNQSNQDLPTGNNDLSSRRQPQQDTSTDNDHNENFNQPKQITKSGPENSDNRHHQDNSNGNMHNDNFSQPRQDTASRTGNVRNDNINQPDNDNPTGNARTDNINQPKRDNPTDNFASNIVKPT